MKKVYEIVVITPSGETFSHFFSSQKIAMAQQARTRSDWQSFVMTHKVFNFNW